MTQSLRLSAVSSRGKKESIFQYKLRNKGFHSLGAITLLPYPSFIVEMVTRLYREQICSRQCFDTSRHKSSKCMNYLSCQCIHWHTKRMKFSSSQKGWIRKARMLWWSDWEFHIQIPTLPWSLLGDTGFIHMLPTWPTLQSYCEDCTKKERMLSILSPHWGEKVVIHEVRNKITRFFFLQALLIYIGKQQHPVMLQIWDG